MGNRTSILYVSPTAIHGGAEEILVRMTAYAKDLGYRPVVIAPSAGWLEQQCEAINIPFEIVSTLPDTMVSDHWSQQFAPWLPNAMAISRIARKWDAKLIHANSPRVSYHSGLAARLAGVGAITHVHDIVNTPYSSAKKARLLCKLANVTITVSQAVANAVISSYPPLEQHIRVLYNGWDLSSYAAVEAANLNQLFKIPHGSFVIGSVSALTPWKGQDVLVRAFQAIKERIPAAHLLIVGGTQGNPLQSQYEAALKAQAIESGLGQAITFTGWREDAWSLIKSFDVFAHVPTQPDPLPTALLHASALGTVSVASNIGGIPEMVLHGRTGIIVPPSDVRELVAAVTYLADHPQYRWQLAHSAQEFFITRFSGEQMRRGLATVYQEFARQTRGDMVIG